MRKTRVYHTFNFDKPSFVYFIENEGDMLFNIEFIHARNCKIIINDDVFYCALPLKPFYASNPVILNKEKEKIGAIRYYGWTFKKKTVKLENESENWVYGRSASGLPMIKKQDLSIAIDVGKNEKPFRFSDLFKADEGNVSKVRVIVEGEISNQFLLIGLAICMFEIEQYSSSD